MDSKAEENHNSAKERKQWYTYVTVEPPMFLYMMAYMITSVIEQTFYVFQACRVNHGQPEDVCYNIQDYEDINKEVQVTVSTFHQWNGIAANIIPLLLAFFLGTYSDKRGRKVLLLVGLLGKLYFSIVITLNTMFLWPVEYIIYTATFPSALTGSDLAIFAACFSYIADVSSLKNRTLRVGILDIVYLSAMPSGVALGNFIFNKLVDRSFTWMFIINTTLMVIATLYSIFFLKWQTRPEQKSLFEAGVKNPITDFFDLRNIGKTIVTLTKRRSNNRRLILWFLLISMAFYTFQRDEKPVMYLYALKVLKWDTTDFSNFRTFASTSYVTVMLFGIPLMTKVLKWKDTVILMLGASSHIAGHFTYTQATAGTTMYIGATLAALGPCVAPVIRSMASKVLAPSERGVVYAFLSVNQTAVAMCSSLIYMQIYKATIDTDYITAIFFFTIATQGVVFLLSMSMELMLKGKNLEAPAEEVFNK
ncbi:solute carrier family 46 member 3 [Aricia agestis]|uniref:solute carrier family 46 member 3 n=1 Tax=Aricia agestis TaxID=91739 RepID=UPI001C201CCF|nr:solute carrier family 46 member 3 [Aricia agestis]